MEREIEERKEFVMLRDHYKGQWGQSITSASASFKNIERPLPNYSLVRRDEQQEAARPQPGAGGPRFTKEHMNQNDGPERSSAPQTYRPKENTSGKWNRSNDTRPTPPRHLSRHPMINGRPDCRSKPLESWEHDYLKENMYQGLKYNLAGFGSGPGNFRYREIQNSNWRHREMEEMGRQIARPQDEQPTRNVERNEDVPHMTCEEFDGKPCKERPSNSARCMSVIIGFEKEKIGQSMSASEGVKEKGLTLKSYLNAANSKKRARTMDIENILNDELAAKILKKSVKRERRVVKQLREIVGRIGKGPVNYKKSAEDIKVEVSLIVTACKPK
ncbi:hypothetical protein K3495_g14644 [Podosphaera aphanis]|nr:hypothetical protein K3495_g14644 [Podosphaera aphanis]